MVAALIVRPEALELRDMGGAVIAALDYRSDPFAALEVLRSALGPESSAEEFHGSSEVPPTTTYTWDGLAFLERRYVDHWAFAADEPRTLTGSSFDVWVSGPTAAGIPIEAEGGFVVGMPWSTVLAAPGLQTNPSGCSGPYVDFVTERLDRPDGAISDRRVAVDFWPDDTATTLARITAPTTVYEDGCV
ncbi:hypothetical protein M3147_05395 [Agromyces mediolanus]|uniref:hypothetical protein n=1 Tax=Agromyces mediolanus TaxID=41986 RepID=UPI00203B6AE1|nr:hypothetical protein [Agromyces mediolanus]MCM3656684.1 hypothetical protein [Agromyces mediolanus]